MNRTFATVITLALLGAFMAASASAAKVITIAPPQVEIEKNDTGNPEKWSFFVRDATDARPGIAAGDKAIGVADQRFSKDDASIELDLEPAVFLSEQFSRFLFLRGMEASAPERAKIFVDLSLERFEVERDSTAVTDKTTFYLGFSARFFTRGGEELGTVTLSKNQWMKKVTPFGDEKKLGQLITAALTGALKTLEKSDIYLLAAEK